ncbi:MAG TPA: hypothetical protein PLO89_03730 [Spirochaetota bacterium]|nr:hypothetical protein [Spirochaetota bacterium]
MDNAVKNEKFDIIVFLEKRSFIPLIITFAFIYILMGVKMNLGLIFTDTILTGGDSASWLQSADHLKNHLLPNGRLFGWSLANFFGYNELQYYFVPPFLFAAILGIFMPLTIALKITTLVGAFTLPMFFFISLKKITKNLWISLMGSVLSLVFLFNESYTMFGGNFLSTFAGEFAYSFSMSIFVLFIGICWETFEKNKSPIFAGILLGLTGLSHMFVFMPAFFVPFFFIFIPKILDSVNNSSLVKNGGGSKKNKTSKESVKDEGEKIEFSTEKNLEKILFIYVIVFIIMAFWILPMALTRSYSTSISMIWRFKDMKDFFGQTFFAIINVGFLFSIFILINSFKDRILALFSIYFYLVCAFFYFISTFLEIPDIRFVPPAIIISIFSIAFFFNYTPKFFSKKESKYTNPIILVLLCVVISVFVVAYPKNVTSWFNWNYTGYEAKKEYPNLEKIVAQYKGNIDSGRLLWEKQNQNDNADFGSERGFENLLFFTGRPSTEGVHYGSSFMARATTYMQSEYSLNPVDPEANRIYSVVNPDGWPTRFYQTNSKDIILYSDDLKNKFAIHKDFEKTGEFGKFHLYTFKNFPKSYVRVTDFDKISVVKDNKYGFRTDFYRHFRDYELFDLPFVFEKNAGDLKSKCKYYKNYDEYYSERFPEDYDFDKWLESYKYKESVTSERVDHFKIEFDTAEVGKPHLINVTYSKNFKSKNGEKIYPVSPGFMMIIPEKNQVRIYYGWNIYEIIGLILTLLIIPVIIFRKKIFSINFPFQKEIRLVALAIFLILVAFFLFETLFNSRKIHGDYKKAEKLVNQLNDYNGALRIINKYATLDYLDRYDNSIIYNFYTMKARILSNTGKKKEAKEVYEYIFRRYNHARMNDNFRGHYNSL